MPTGQFSCRQIGLVITFKEYATSSGSESTKASRKVTVPLEKECILALTMIIF